MPPVRSRRLLVASSIYAGLLAIASACGANAAPVGAAAGAPAPAPLRIALASHAGSTELDGQIRAVQAKVQERLEAPRLERLAALFIAKARSGGDAGFYKQAEACALAMQGLEGGAQAAQLVLGHVRHAMHDFPAAERIARQLTASRGMFLDHGLLGDVLLDQGRLEEAREVYQRMVDSKPCLQSYARIAQLRWLYGDLDGARELLATAAGAGSQRDPESLAWVWSRRAQIELQVGFATTAKQMAEKALGLVEGYPAAMAVLGRAAWALGEADLAVRSLSAAAERSVLPEHLWAHADILRAAGRIQDAELVEAELLRSGEREDPRTFALWLATTNRQPAHALQLAEAELRLRQDVLTYDVVAVARLREGDLEGAHTAMQSALATGLREPRLRLHAGALAIARGDRASAASHLAAARLQEVALLPSERTELSALLARL